MGAHCFNSCNSFKVVILCQNLSNQTLSMCTTYCSWICFYQLHSDNADSRGDKTVSVKVPAAKPVSLSSVPGIHVREREPTPLCFPWTSIYTIGLTLTPSKKGEKVQVSQILIPERSYLKSSHATW